MGTVVAIAMSMNNVWIPPAGRPYWIGGSNTGPHLTDVELDVRGLSYFKKYPFDKVWAESIEVGIKTHSKKF